MKILEKKVIMFIIIISVMDCIEQYNNTTLISYQKSFALRKLTLVDFFFHFSSVMCLGFLRGEWFCFSRLFFPISLVVQTSSGQVLMSGIIPSCSST